MDPLSEYLQKLCIANAGKRNFVIDVGEVASDLLTSCMVLGSGHIIRILGTVINRPHITTVSKDGSQITVEIIRS